MGSSTNSATSGTMNLPLCATTPKLKKHMDTDFEQDDLEHLQGVILSQKAEQHTTDTDDLHGDALRFGYVPLSEARTWGWEKNPKRHDMEGIIESIHTHGFKDPSKYEGLLEGFGHGNGRVQALAQIMDAWDLDYETVPRGILLDDEDNWYVPVLFGVDADSVAKAQAYAIDHNNLTVAGSDLTPDQVSSMWYGEEYLSVLQEMRDDDVYSTTVDQQEIDRLFQQLSVPLSPPDDEDPMEDPDELETDYECPQCGYEWSGSAKPTS